MGDPVAMTTGDGVAAFGRMRACQDDEVELRLGERVLHRTTRRLYSSHHVIPYRGREAVLVEHQGASLGMDTAFREAVVLSIPPGDGLGEELFRIELGDELFDADCRSAFGCAAWTASWRVELRGRLAFLVVEPVLSSARDGRDRSRWRVPAPRTWPLGRVPDGRTEATL